MKKGPKSCAKNPSNFRQLLSGKTPLKLHFFPKDSPPRVRRQHYAGTRARLPRLRRIRARAIESSVVGRRTLCQGFRRKESQNGGQQGVDKHDSC